MFKEYARMASLVIAAALIFIVSPKVQADGFPFFDESTKDGGTLADTDVPREWLQSAATDWMGKLPDELSFGKLSVPGTHDTGARYGGAACQTQRWAINEQLEAGIRYLDIRNRRTKTSFAIHHGLCFQQIMFGDVLQQIQLFLNAHPKETILMRVKEEYTPEDGSDSFQSIWDGYMKSYGNLFVKSTDIDNIAKFTLGQSRGRIIALRNADFVGYGVDMYGDTNINIQDSYQVYYLANDNPFGGATVSFSQKMELVKKYITEAEGDLGVKLFLNHLSGAIGMIPTDVARGTNDIAYTNIGAYHGKKTVGVLIADEPGEKLIYRTIQSNFSSNTSCAAKTFSTESAASYANFALPASATGTDIKFVGGAYNHYVFPKCNRVTWTDLVFTCGGDGQWIKNGTLDADAWCTASNTAQPYLTVGDK